MKQYRYKFPRHSSDELFEPSKNYDDNAWTRYLIDLHNIDHQLTDSKNQGRFLNIDHNAPQYGYPRQSEPDLVNSIRVSKENLSNKILFKKSIVVIAN